MAIPLAGLALPLLEIGSTWLKGRVDTAKENAAAKVELAKARTMTALRLQEQAQSGDVQWELIQAANSATSWKDEWLTILFSIPLILAFCGDWGRAAVEAGFGALELMPEWYRWAVGIILMASFGVKRGKNIADWWASNAGK